MAVPIDIRWTDADDTSHIGETGARRYVTSMRIAMQGLCVASVARGAHRGRYRMRTRPPRGSHIDAV